MQIYRERHCVHWCIGKLAKSDIRSIENLISLKILSQSDIDIVERYGLGAQLGKNPLETEVVGREHLIDFLSYVSSELTYDA